MARGVQLKLEQNLAVRDMLLRTRDRPIEDRSRLEDQHWCIGQGQGNNRHAELLMAWRDRELGSSRPT